MTDWPPPRQEETLAEKISALSAGALVVFLITMGVLLIALFYAGSLFWAWAIMLTLGAADIPGWGFSRSIPLGLLLEGVLTSMMWGIRSTINRAVK